MTNKPNILFFFTDDQRFDTIAALGNEEVHTPNLDKLVSEGTTFTHAHIPGGTCGAVCMPSRAMLHTGRTLFHLEGEGQNIPEEHTLLGELLQQYGYRTFGTGKWHNGTSAYARSFTDGGEIFFGGMGDHWNVPAHNFDPTGNYENRAKKIRNPFYANNVIENICDHVTPGKHSTELFSDITIKFLENYDFNNTEEPFFAYVSFMAPHDPRSVPEEFLKMYDPADIELPENFQAKHFNYGVKTVRDEVLAPYPRTPEEVKRHIAEYYGMISHLDYQIGRVLDTLEKTGQRDNTIIVFAGDNGLAVGQHGLMGKQNHYEHSVRVPLIFAGPGIPVNEKRDAYTYLLDIFPTLCDLLDIDVPASVEGKSLVPVISSLENEIRDTLYFAYTDLMRGVKDKRYKLIEYVGNDTYKTQLFDLVEDPLEMNNLYGQEKYSEIVDRLKNELIKYRDEWDDCNHPLGRDFWNKYTR